MAKFLTILATLTIFSGCCNAPFVAPDIPPRPELIPVQQEVWERVPLEAQDIWTYNDLALKEHIRRLEARLQALE